MSQTRRGIYIPTANKCKYTKEVHYRSSYEHAFALLLDKAKVITRWEFEQMHIAYNYHSNSHKYLLDFWCDHVSGIRYLIEVKPYAFYVKAMRDKDINFHKWNAAISFANKHGYEFKVLTEQGLILLTKAWGC